MIGHRYQRSSILLKIGGSVSGSPHFPHEEGIGRRFSLSPSEVARNSPSPNEESKARKSPSLSRGDKGTTITRSPLPSSLAEEHLQPPPPPLPPNNPGQGAQQHVLPNGPFLPLSEKCGSLPYFFVPFSRGISAEYESYKTSLSFSPLHLLPESIY